MLSEHLFDSREAASIAAAARIAGLVGAQLKRDGESAFVVGGGSSPVQCFEYLSGYELDWQNVTVIPSDERWVANDHDDSNEKMIRERLLVNQASDAHILAIYEEGLSADERCEALQSHYPDKGFACAQVGMGNDGHFASLFPDSDCLASGLSPDNTQFFMPVRTAASPHPRVSMTLAALQRSDEILLLFFGDEKKAVYETARSGESTYPIAALLQQTTTPVSLYWAP